jgi:hypothetical protein
MLNSGQHRVGLAGSSALLLPAAPAPWSIAAEVPMAMSSWAARYRCDPTTMPLDTMSAMLLSTLLPMLFVALVPVVTSRPCRSAPMR